MAVDFEKLGVFYLGRLLDPETREATGENLLYASKDLTTHAACVGMTGSGKTGLCLALLEEAAIDGVPAIAIDPKGDLGNLLLTFPGLQASDFRPWVDDAEAARQGLSADALAERVAGKWRDGLAAWGQDGARIQRLRDAVDMAVYTPGSDAGLPLSVLRSFAAPSSVVLADGDALRERVAAGASALLGLLGIDADPLRSREHVLVATILDTAWREGRSLDIGSLIREIQSPPFRQVGVMDLESFFPGKDRFALAMQVNNLLASPSFGAWLTGDPLDVQRLLWTPEGKARLSIVSIAHLPESERMFFVTLLLSEVVAWMRAQPGTGSLRAILYMDEVFGYLPPVANPPSKAPMLTLLKQARASGLGIVLATQNPVDLDYKALSNTGTWFIGRLQTERDVARVIDGLEGASTAAGRGFDRGRIEALIGGLSQRRFLMNDVHEEAPVLLESRWAMSYLRGPLTRAQIQSLMASRKAPKSAPGTISGGTRPVLPPGVQEIFLGSARPDAAYTPRLLARARLHHVSAKDGVDEWRDVAYLAPILDSGEIPWDEAAPADAASLVTSPEPASGATFAALPPGVADAKSLAALGKEFGGHLLRSAPLLLFRCKELDETSKPGESEGDLRARLMHAAREARDEAVEELRLKAAPRIARLQERIRLAEARVTREQQQYSERRTQATISFGATVLGAIFGRRSVMGTLGRATTAARGASRAATERDDVGKAQESVETLRAQLADLEAEVAADAGAIEGRLDPASVALERIEIAPRKSDIDVAPIVIAWGAG